MVTHDQLISFDDISYEDPEQQSLRHVGKPLLSRQHVHYTTDGCICNTSTPRLISSLAPSQGEEALRLC